jgi:large subunit ribosomal protein L35
MKGKLKTHRGAAKRFKITGTGKIVRKQAGKRHLLTGKSPRRKRSLETTAPVHSGETKMLRRLLPYGN